MNIKLVDCGKEYNKKEVLFIEELNFKEGAVYALMGLNGSGKTTLLQCASGLENFTRGKVFYNGGEWNNSIKKEISVMLQKPYLFDCSVKENLIMGLRFRKFDKKVIQKRLEEYMKYLDIRELMNKRPKELSGGEQSKIALIRTAILETKVTFLDEPTASMDIDNTLKAEELIKFMAVGKKSVILVTHDLFQADRIADYVIFLDKGKIIEHGSKHKVFNYPTHKLLKQILKKE